MSHTGRVSMSRALAVARHARRARRSGLWNHWFETLIRFCQDACWDSRGMEVDMILSR